ncbi:MAG: tetratricopeptide repeat protein [Bacteroidota bacterium]
MPEIVSSREQNISHSEYQKSIDKLLEQSFMIRIRSIESATELANEALRQSEEVNYIRGKAYAYCYLAFYTMIISDFTTSQRYVKLAGDLLKDPIDRSALALNAYTLGSIHYKTSDYHQGLKYLLHGYQLYKADGDIQGQSRTLKAVGSLYEFFKDYDSAKDTYLKCVRLSKQIDDPVSLSNVYNPLSGIYLRENNIKEALEVIESSIQLKQESGDIRGLAFALYGKGKVLARMGDYHSAKEHYLKSLEIHQESGEKPGASMCLGKLGELYLKLKDYDKAEEYFELSIREAEESRHNLIIYKSYESLYKIAKSMGDMEKALYYLEKHVEYKTNIINHETNNVIKSIRSISELEMLEREAQLQREKKEEVEKKNAELDTFVYKVSHDLKGPVSSLLGLFNVIESEIVDPNALKYFNLYNDQAQQLHKILTDLINLVRIKQASAKLEEIDFKEIIENCIYSYRYMPSYGLIKFDVSIEDNLSFNSEPSTIRSILQNLIENGIKYCRTDVTPFVKVSVAEHPKKEELIISVEDNGMGIKEEYQKFIFDMFFRANDRIQGSGLGLYILKKGVEKLEGRLSFESKYNEGTRFIIELPLNRPSEI